MPIQPLDDTTVRAIGATQVLADPAAVVKELVDNSLDARATSVSIEISSNTVDVIRVRDNGHGIAPEDRSVVARANCTSKLKTFEDIRLVSFKSLGFRGQALASAAEMSGNLTISTRVEGEEVAAILEINRLGEVVAQRPGSLPVGTTVRVTDFAKSNPVRRQHILKNTEKCLRTIKRCLHAYAFARPHVRLSLRVLNSKTQKVNWTYAPKPGGSVEDTAVKIVGSPCVQQCTRSVLEDSGFILDAFLPRPDGEPCKVSNVGAFVSVDGRPLSASRSTIKNISKFFREALKSADQAFDGVKEPFIHIKIACPPESYDPNIEPAKDDVLFEDDKTLFDLFTKLFQTVYPTSEANTTRARPSVSDVFSPAPLTYHNKGDHFVNSVQPAKALSSNTAWSVPEAIDDIAHQHTASTDLCSESNPSPGRGRHQQLRHNMYGCDEGDLEVIGMHPPVDHTEIDIDEPRHARKDPKLFNPWVVAKMNAPIRFTESNSHNMMPDIDRGRSMPPLTPFSPTYSQLPTPRPSSPSQGDTDVVDDAGPHKHIRLYSIHSVGLPSRENAARQTQLSIHPRLGLSDATAETSIMSQQSTIYTPADDTHETPSPVAPPGPMPAPRPFLRRQDASTRLKRPFVLPTLNREKVWFDHLQRDSRPPKRARRQYPACASGNTNGDAGRAWHIDEPRPLSPPLRNRDIREYIDATDSIVQGSVSDLTESSSFEQFSTSFLHMNRSREARMLRELSNNPPNPQRTLGDEDRYEPQPHTRPLGKPRRTTNGISDGPSGTKSPRLLLDWAPEGQETHDLVFRCGTSIASIARTAEYFGKISPVLRFNQPVLNACDVVSELFKPDILNGLTTRLRDLLNVEMPGVYLDENLGQVLKDGITQRSVALYS